MTNDERARLDVIEGKLDTVLVKLSYIEDRAKDQEYRLRGVEKWKSAIPVSILVGVAAGLGAIFNNLGA